MNSIRCPQCDLLHWETDEKCKRCGCLFNGAVHDGPATYGADDNPAVQHNASADSNTDVPVRPAPWLAAAQPEPTGNKKSGLAIFSLVAGILSVPPLFSFVILLIGGILSLIFGVGGFIAGVVIGLCVIPAGLVTGIVAVKRVKRAPHIYGGKGMAIGGIVCSSTGFVIIPVIAAIAIPNLLASRRAANEGSAIQSLRKLNAAQATFVATVGSGNCGELSQLRSAGLVDEKIAGGTMNGYKYELAFDNSKRSCFAYATPESLSMGTRSFLLSDDGVIHAAVKNGARAELKDPALGN